MKKKKGFWQWINNGLHNEDFVGFIMSLIGFFGTVAVIAAAKKYNPLIIFLLPIPVLCCLYVLYLGMVNEEER